MDLSISCDSLINEILAEEFFKDNFTLVDRASIYRWVNILLRKFGVNVMQKHELIVKVENYRANLPENFGYLSLSILCEPESYSLKSGCKDTLINSYYWKERIVNLCIEDCEDSCDPTKEKRIIEKYYFHNEGDEGEVHVNYRQLHYLKLGKNIIRGRCMTDCINKYKHCERDTIDIVGNTLNANFKEGLIYMVYYATPMDEDGVPIIPKTKNGNLETYVEYHIKRKILENAVLSKDLRDRRSMLGYFRNEEKELEREAIADTSPFSMQTFWESINKKRSDIRKFELY